MSKIRRRQCKSLKEFDKIVRKYLKYFRNNYIYSTYWYTWLWYDALGLENVKKLIPYAEKKLYTKEHLKHIINTVIANYNWSFKHANGSIYYLRGIEISNEDYYYIYVNEAGHKLYNSCVGKFSDVSYYQKEITLPEVDDTELTVGRSCRSKSAIDFNGK